MRCKMYNLYVTYTAKDKETIHKFYDEVKENGIIAASQIEEGNYRYEYYFSAERENEILILEKWKDKDAQEFHDTLPHLVKLGEIKVKYGIETSIEEV